MKCTIFLNKLEELKKLFNKYACKAAAIGIDTALSVSESYIKSIPVYEYDDINKCLVKTGCNYVDVCDININFPEYKLGEYNLIAVLDHTISNNENAVYNFTDSVELPIKYRTCKAVCEHCKTNRIRNNTAVLIDDSGNYKQIGMNCLQEYTGINDIDIVKAFLIVEQFINESDIEKNEYTGKTKYLSTRDYLANCIHFINKYGYKKSLKEEAFDSKLFTSNSAADYENADKVINYFRNNTFKDDFLNNIHVHLLNDHAKESGFIAYAYEAYKKQLEKAASVANTAFYGNTGDKVKIAVSGKCVSSYLSRYGYDNIVTTYIYQFTDSENHVFIWKTSTEMQLNENGVFNGILSGTIKEHKQYNGVNQTVLTRCKVC